MDLLSKNTPLEISIEKMQTIIQELGYELTFSKEKHPLHNCFSVNLASVDVPNYIYSNGKGVCSEASFASAYGEFIERLQTNNFFIDFYLPQRKYYPDEKVFDFDGAYLDIALKKIYNPSGDLEEKDLVDFNSDYMDKIVTLPFIQNSSKEIKYFPINILSNLYVSNGLATGNTPSEAKVQGLSEIFERYVKNEIIKHGYALPKYPDEVLKKYTKVYEDVVTLRNKGYIVEVLDASLGGKYPVTAISFINPNNGTLFVSFGAHPLLEVSLERTMTELMQGRDFDMLDGFEHPTFDMELVSDTFNLEAHFIDSNGKLGFPFLSKTKSFAYSSWKYSGNNSDDELEFLLDILERENKELYIREYDYLGFYSCQLLVPTMSEVYPIDDMVYNNKNSGKFIRDMVLNFYEYEPEDILEAIESLEDSISVQLYIGVVFENDFTILDFKIQLYFLLEEYESALALLTFSKKPMAKIVSELILLELNGYDFDEYEEGLESVYGERMQEALDIYNLDVAFIDTTLASQYENILKMYDGLDVKKKKNY